MGAVEQGVDKFLGGEVVMVFDVVVDEGGGGVDFFFADDADFGRAEGNFAAVVINCGNGMVCEGARPLAGQGADSIFWQTKEDQFF